MLSKTQLAVELCHQKKEGNVGDIFWINAESERTLISSCTEILNIIAPDNVEAPVSTYKSLVAKWTCSLLVLDNVNHPDDVVEFLKYRRTGDILVTTRDSAMAGSERFPYGIQISSLTRTQSMLLFALNCYAWTAEQTSQIREDFAELPDSTLELPTSIAPVFRTKFDIRFLSQLDNLAKLTGDLPLAIVQCASYLKEFPMSYARYLNRFDSVSASSRRKFLGTKAKGAQYDNSVMTTWDITFDELSAAMPNATRMLTLFGFLGRTDTSEDFLETARLDLEFWGGLGHLS